MIEAIRRPMAQTAPISASLFVKREFDGSLNRHARVDWKPGLIVCGVLSDISFPHVTIQIFSRDRKIHRLPWQDDICSTLPFPCESCEPRQKSPDEGQA